MSTADSANTYHPAHHFRDADHEFQASKEGIWLFLCTEILMFGGLFVGYIIYHGIYPEMFAFGAKSLDWRLGALNTLVLLFSSLTMALGIHYFQKAERTKALWALGITILCGACFMFIKYLEYSHKIHLGLLPGKFFHGDAGEFSNSALYFSFYYLMTGLHGLHVLIGMGLISWVWIRGYRGDFGPSYYTPVEGVGLFWHVVDLVWIYLFPLLYLIG